jgi:hypothetical protein
MKRKRTRIPSRRERLMSIVKELQRFDKIDMQTLDEEGESNFFDLETQLEELYYEIDNWRAGIEDTNLRYTMKFDIIDECANNLEELQEKMSYFVDDFKEGKNMNSEEVKDFEFTAENIVFPGLF